VFWFGILVTILAIIVVIHRFGRSGPELEQGRIGRDEFDENAKREWSYWGCGLIEHKPPPSESQIRNTLHVELWAATERAREASEAFITITREVPTGITYPEWVQRIRDASRDVSLTRAELMRAHKRVQDYLGRGIVPENDTGDCRPHLKNLIVPPLPPRRSHQLTARRCAQGEAGTEGRRLSYGYECARRAWEGRRAS
jgi:hypothetical protein